MFEIDGVSYIYLMHHSLYVVAITNINADASLILMFLHELLKVFTGYFGKLEEENIRDNFVVIHELLDEMLDFGYPQVTNVNPFSCVPLMWPNSLLFPDKAAARVHQDGASSGRHGQGSSSARADKKHWKARRHRVSEE